MFLETCRSRQGFKRVWAMGGPNLVVTGRLQLGL